MATPAATVSDQYGQDDGLRAVWTLTTADHTGAALGPAQFQHADMCFQAVAAADGSTWGGATLAIEGSNDGTNFFALTNASGGAAVTFTANGGKQIIEKPFYVRPRLSAVGVGATVVITLAARRNPRRR